MAIIYRTDGAWGGGKGSRLVKEEVDGNFYDLDQRLVEMEENPPVAVSIASIEVNANMVVFTMTDSSQFGPFLLPTARWNPTGEWVANRQYSAFDIFSNDGNLYIVRFSHTADSTFDPDADQGSGFLYMLILEQPAKPIDIPFNYSGSIPINGSLIAQYVVTRDLSIPSDIVESQAYLQVAPSTLILTFELRKASVLDAIETVFGTITFDFSAGPTFDGGMAGVFAGIGSPTEETVFAAGDRINIYAATNSPDEPDPAASGLTVTLRASTVPITS